MAKNQISTLKIERESVRIKNGIMELILHTPVTGSLYARTTRSLEVKRPVVSPDNLSFCELYSRDTMNIEVGCGL